MSLVTRDAASLSDPDKPKKDLRINSSRVTKSRPQSSRECSKGFADDNIGDAIGHRVQSLDSYKRRLYSYKTREDIAMELVFKPVTQQDSVRKSSQYWP
ncbi:hypothetical protein FOCG_01881 [Fusarium oxysporum f. sp. radicis-lycopersici 26381]|nr:hypothetical protein FOCG_01881 [Fusarium oxysporum f. sp. radicis-lycopersici 26381]